MPSLPVMGSCEGCGDPWPVWSPRPLLCMTYRSPFSAFPLHGAYNLWLSPWTSPCVHLLLLPRVSSHMYSLLIGFPTVFLSQCFTPFPPRTTPDSTSQITVSPFSDFPQHLIGMFLRLVCSELIVTSLDSKLPAARVCHAPLPFVAPGTVFCTG